MSEKLKHRLKIAGLVLSVYFIWIVVIGNSVDEDALGFAAIPFTIITIYVWKHFTNKQI